MKRISKRSFQEKRAESREDYKELDNLEKKFVQLPQMVLVLFRATNRTNQFRQRSQSVFQVQVVSENNT